MINDYNIGFKDSNNIINKDPNRGESLRAELREQNAWYNSDLVQKVVKAAPKIAVGIGVLAILSPFGYFLVTKDTHNRSDAEWQEAEQNHADIAIEKGHLPATYNNLEQRAGEQ